MKVREIFLVDRNQWQMQAAIRSEFSLASLLVFFIALYSPNFDIVPVGEKVRLVACSWYFWFVIVLNTISKKPVVNLCFKAAFYFVPIPCRVMGNIWVSRSPNLNTGFFEKLRNIGFAYIKEIANGLHAHQFRLIEMGNGINVRWRPVWPSSCFPNGSALYPKFLEPVWNGRKVNAKPFCYLLITHPLIPIKSFKQSVVWGPPCLIPHLPAFYTMLFKPLSGRCAGYIVSFADLVCGLSILVKRAEFSLARHIYLIDRDTSRLKLCLSLLLSYRNVKFMKPLDNRLTLNAKQISNVFCAKFVQYIKSIECFLASVSIFTTGIFLEFIHAGNYITITVGGKE